MAALYHYIFVPKTITAWRKVRKLSPEKLAVYMLRTRSTIVNWERGKTEPIASEVCELANFFGTSPDKLFARVKKRGNHGSSNQTTPATTS